MVGFIKNLIGGIVGFITGLFSKKGNGYYLELKEEATGTTVAAPTPAAPAPTPVAVKATKAEPAKAPVVVKETSFASKYLVPGATNSNGRRLPGANMNIFLDMAREIKNAG